jgi:hypothetical protein
MTAKSDVIARIDQTGDISASGVTVITATEDNVMLSTRTGDMSFRDKTTITSGTDTVMLIDQGNLTTRAATTVTAGQDILATLLDGYVSFSDKTTLDAERNVIIAARNGLTGSELSAMHGENVNVIITEGAVTLLNSALVDAGTDASLAVTTGNVEMYNNTIMTAGHDASVEVQTGDVLLKDNAVITAVHDVAVDVTTGDVALSNSALVNAGNDASVQIGQGDLTLIDDVIVRAVDDISVNIDTGTVQMRSDALINAGDDVTMLIGQGYVLMQDARTLIRAQDVKITVETGFARRGGSIWLDRIEGSQSVWLRALDGRILDNTKAQDVDLIVTKVMALEASDGIGIIWEDNLNTDADYFTGYNSRSGGINVQNRTALTIGDAGILNGAPKGLVNYGEEDIAVVAPGVVSHLRTFYGVGDRFANGTVANLRGQGIFLVHNLGQPYFWEQLGDTTRARMSAQMDPPVNVVLRHLQAEAKVKADLERRLRNAGETSSTTELGQLNSFNAEEDAFSKLSDRLSKFRNSEEIRSIRKSREILNIAVVDASEGGQGDLYDPFSLEASTGQMLGRANMMDGTDLNSVDLDSPLLPQIEELEENGAGNEEGLEQRPVLQSALELADDNLDAPLIAAE